ncbi:hypothetical protein [Bowmanella dokdonensis]|uniref:DUF1440 domain-containing protein n=1 Tax=Bowmanella dokdonensis TaxID=751969 RepID=A0A939IP06_9ALTE|nr:hypothetical protein [Bowmanella dokdonensis]MBN7825390.1 hypothetical protein [Bowmanella dokdonensis]
MLRSYLSPFILMAGLIAGSLDILYACLFWYVKAGLPPTRILQSVAAGLLGQGSFQGGLGTAAAGLLLHFMIALLMAATYFVMAQRYARLHRSPLVWGAIYGMLLYLVMTYVVVPLSAAGPSPEDPLWQGFSLLVHILAVGIPIAMACKMAHRLE